MIENLEYIRDNGIDKFLKKQEEKYQCSKCGGVICVHNGKCYSCGKQIKINEIG
jgi:ribosomal protein S27AE